MSVEQRRPIDFNPYKRPPAARLLAVLAVASLFAWILRSGDARQLDQFHRDPVKFAARLEKMSHHGVGFDIVVSLLMVSVIVFVVDGLTSLFSRWLTERELPRDGSASSGGEPGSSRADAMLGASDTTPPSPPQL